MTKQLYKCPKCQNEINIGAENKRLMLTMNELCKDKTALKEALREAVEIYTESCSFCKELPSECPSCEVKIFIKKSEELLK